jgi:hypothetical protein
MGVMIAISCLLYYIWIPIFIIALEGHFIVQLSGSAN